ncbi:26507_t:CDS:1 [Gigaspora margarita]|uniref:26507_t:CDS:1 n=1 Tax=Gigaspora margarita TaxID=4874 RepID=A0ABM8W3B9_GIGMA|nr:26507_t:CDS:1 [Gigaspora margarita]
MRTMEGIALIYYYTTVPTTNELVPYKGCSWAEESLRKQKCYIPQAIRSQGTVHVDSTKKVHGDLEDISFVKSRLTDCRELKVKKEPMMIITARLRDAFSEDKEMFEVKSVGSNTGAICFEILTLTQKTGTHTMVKYKIKRVGDLHVLKIQNATWPSTTKITLTTLLVVGTIVPKGSSIRIKTNTALIKQVISEVTQLPSYLRNTLMKQNHAHYYLSLYKAVKKKALHYNIEVQEQLYVDGNNTKKCIVEFKPRDFLLTGWPL